MNYKAIFIILVAERTSAILKHLQPLPSMLPLHHQDTFYIHFLTNKGLVINYGEGEGGGLRNEKIADRKLFAPPPPPSRQGQTFPVPHQYG